MLNLDLYLAPFDALLFDALTLLGKDRSRIQKLLERHEYILSEKEKHTQKYILHNEERLIYEQIRFAVINELVSRLTMLDYKCAFDALDQCRKRAKKQKLKSYGFTILFNESNFPTIFIY